MSTEYPLIAGEEPIPFRRSLRGHSTSSRRLKEYKSIKKTAIEEMVNEIESKEKHVVAGFGTSKWGDDARLRYRRSLERYEKNELPNLYGIIIPSGMGKSTLAKRYGVLDPDDILTDLEHRKLQDMRAETLMLGKNGDWGQHNKFWYDRTRDMLNKLDHTRSRILLCHTEEFCIEVGARPICAVSTNASFGLHIEDGREPIEMRFGMMNRRKVIQTTLYTRLHMVNNHDEVEAIFCGYAMQYIAIPHPMRVCHLPITPVGYSKCPEWLLEWNIANRDMREVEILHRNGMIPDCVLQKFMMERYELISDRGVFDSDLQWLRILQATKDNLGKYERWSFDESFLNRSKLEADRGGVKLKDIYDKFNLDGDEYVNIVLGHHVGSSKVLVGGILIYYAAVMKRMRSELRELIIKSNLLLLPETVFGRINKEAHAYVRVSKEFMGMKLTSEEQRDLMYLHVLVGRKYYTVDPTEEIAERRVERKPYIAFGKSGWSNSEYIHQRDNAIKWLYRSASGKRLRGFDTFLEFWVKREDYVAKGSTVLSEDFEKKYQVRALINGVVKEVERRHNKKSLFEQEGIKELMADLIIKKWGTNRTKGVPKMNEAGAERVLFPGELIQYTVMLCAYMCFADIFPIGSTNLFTIDQESIYKYDLRIRDTLEGLFGEGNWTKDNYFCFDFKNFNIQHTVDDMVAMINGIQEHAPTYGDFLHLCFIWVEDSLRNMKIVDNDGREHKVVVGLYSGWIFTMVLNCMGNDVYSNIGNQTSLNLFGKMLLLSREGMGDDLTSRIKYIEDGCVMYEILKKIGYEANNIKQMFGETQEFLRIMYDNNGKFGACVCRLIATFVSGNLEHEPIEIKEMLRTRYEVIEKLNERGIDNDACNNLWECALARWGRIKTSNEWVAIHPTILHGTIECGGFGIPDKNGDLYILAERVVDSREVVEFKLPGMAAAMDKVARLVGDLREIGIEYTPSMEDVERIATDSYDVGLLRDHLSIIDQKDHVWLTEHKILRKIPSSPGNYDVDILFDCFMWMEKEDKILKNLARYKQHKNLVGINKLELMVQCGGWNFTQTEEFSPANLHYNKVPGYLKLQFANYVRCKLLRYEINLQEAYSMYGDLCVTIKDMM